MRQIGGPGILEKENKARRLRNNELWREALDRPFRQLGKRLECKSRSISCHVRLRTGHPEGCSCLSWAPGFSRRYIEMDDDRM